MIHQVGFVSAFWFIFFLLLLSHAVHGWGVMGNRQELLLGAFVKSLMQAAWTWWWFIDDQVQQTIPREYLSKPFPGVQNNLVTFLFLPVISCSELLISSIVSCLRFHSLVPGQCEPWCSRKESFSYSFQPIRKVLDFQTEIDFHDMEGYW